MTILERFKSIKQRLETQKKKRDEYKGALKQTLKQLEEKHGCKNLSEAKKKLAELKKRKKKVKKELDKALKEFEEQWGELL